MSTYEVRNIETGAVITVRAKSAANAARRITKRRTESSLTTRDAQGTGGVYELWTGARFYARVNVWLVK